MFNGYSLAAATGVEIGPLCSPLVERSDARVYYVDHCTTDELREKYSGHTDVVPEAIVDTDFVWGSTPLRELLGADGPVDFVVGSHVIEHVADLIGWLTEMRLALRDGGVLALVVPDKRFTFDVMRRCTSFEEVMSANAAHRTQPGLRAVLDYVCNTVAADCGKLWQDYRTVHEFALAHSEAALTNVLEQLRSGGYVDAHCWVFTPWHFFRTVGWIVEATGLGFDLDYFQTTPVGELEFYVRLKRVDASGTDWSAAAAAAEATALWPEPRSLAMSLAR